MGKDPIDPLKGTADKDFTTALPYHITSTAYFRKGKE